MSMSASGDRSRHGLPRFFTRFSNSCAAGRLQELLGSRRQLRTGFAVRTTATWGEAGRGSWSAQAVHEKNRGAGAHVVVAIRLPGGRQVHGHGLGASAVDGSELLPQL